MKLIAVNLQIPVDTDKHYREEAKKRIVSKSAVMREVLIEAANKAKEAAKAQAEAIAA